MQRGGQGCRQHPTRLAFAAGRWAALRWLSPGSPSRLCTRVPPLHLQGNDSLLQYYGFVEPNNPHDTYALAVPAGGRSIQVGG